MSQTLAIARRELFAYMLSPAGYVIIAVFMLFSSLLFFAFGALLGGGFNQGEPASMRLFFAVSIWMFLFIAPAISMRTISDELRTGTIEMLMTCPVSEARIVLGKFLGSLGFLVLLLAPTVVYVLALEMYGRPDYGELLCGYLGLVLAGGAYLASGMLASTLSSSQVVAYLVTLFFWLTLLMATKGLPYVGVLLGGMAERGGSAELSQTLAGWTKGITAVLAQVDPHGRARGFSIGLVDSFNVVYFVSLTAVFLIAAAKSLEARRWR